MNEKFVKRKPGKNKKKRLFDKEATEKVCERLNLQTPFEYSKIYSGGVFFMLKSQQELNFSQYTDLYDKLIPQNHLFRKLRLDKYYLTI